VHNWFKELRAQPHGSLDLPNGVNVPVELTISAFQSHIKSGKTVARMLEFHVPTKVQLDYLVKDNRFKLVIVGPVAEGLGKSTNKEVMVEKTTEDDIESGGDSRTAEIDDGAENDEESEGDDWLHRNLQPDCYENYDWETRVTAAMARKKNPQGMVCVSNCYFWCSFL
jgi:hypothetical protein